MAKCLQAREMAYCPYSKFPVGAAILTTGGAIVTGRQIHLLLNFLCSNIFTIFILSPPVSCFRVQCWECLIWSYCMCWENCDTESGRRRLQKIYSYSGHMVYHIFQIQHLNSFLLATYAKMNLMFIWSTVMSRTVLWDPVVLNGQVLMEVMPVITWSLHLLVLSVWQYFNFPTRFFFPSL